MNLYLVSRLDYVDYDEYNSFLVCCESEIEAISTHPNGGAVKNGIDYEWPRESPKKVTFIGVADESIEKGVILASFNAG